MRMCTADSTSGAISTEPLHTSAPGDTACVNTSLSRCVALSSSTPCSSHEHITHPPQVRLWQLPLLRYRSQYQSPVTAWAIIPKPPYTDTCRHPARLRPAVPRATCQSVATSMHHCHQPLQFAMATERRTIKCFTTSHSYGLDTATAGGINAVSARPIAEEAGYQGVSRATYR